MKHSTICVIRQGLHVCRWDNLSCLMKTWWWKSFIYQNEDDAVKQCRLCWEEFEKTIIENIYAKIHMRILIVIFFLQQLLMVHQGQFQSWGPTISQHHSQAGNWGPWTNIHWQWIPRSPWNELPSQLFLHQVKNQQIYMYWLSVTHRYT